MEKGCPSCGRMIDSQLNKCPYCNYDFSQLNEMFKHYEEERKTQVPVYAGFIKRTVATGFDWFIISALVLILMAGVTVWVLYNEPLKNDFNNWLLSNYGSPFEIAYGVPTKVLASIYIVVYYLSTLVIYFFYCVFRQCSKKMATAGEKLVGIEVIDNEGLPLTFSKSLWRNFTRILNVLTLGIGYLIIIFTKQKQSLSDMVSKTYVVNKITGEDYDKFRYGDPFARFFAYIIDSVVIWLMMVVVLLILPFISTLVLNIPQLVPFSETITQVFLVIFMLIIISYYPYMESRKGATLGKMFFNLKVKDLDGENISFFRSVARLICGVIEGAVFLGTILCFVTPRKQTLKDLMTKTIVISKR